MSHDDTRDEQLSRLYREAAGEEPSEAIDRAILAAARAEAAPVQPRKRAWWQTWAGPASVAATVVLTVTLTLMVQQEQEHAFIEAPPSKGEAADSAVKPASPPPAVKQEAAPREAERVVGATRQAQEAAEAAPAPKPLAREAKAEPAAPAGTLAPPTSRGGTVKEKLAALRQRWPWLDRTLDVQERFSEVNGSFVSSGVTISIFLAMFPLMLVAIAVVGFIAAGDDTVAPRLVENLGLTGAAADALTGTLERAADTRQAASVIGLLGLAWSGSGVASALQQAVRPGQRARQRTPDL